MLNNFQPAIVADKPLGGIGGGAVLCEGYGVGSVVLPTPAQALPRVRRVNPAAAGFGEQRGSGSATSEQISPKQHTTLIDPAYRATLGPHPAREPEPA
jgi:hypothetical protein